MYPLKEILVPVDFSERSINAVRQSALLAKKSNSKLFIFHTFKRPNAGINANHHEHLALFREKVRSLHKKYDKMVEGIPELKSVSHEFLPEVGISKDKIIETLKDKEIDLIVMATHGTKGLDLIQGSKTTAMIHALKGPILVLPDGSDLSSAKRFATAINFNSKFDVRCIDPIIALVKILGGILKIVNVKSENLPKSEKELKMEESIAKEIGSEVKFEFESVFSDDVEAGLKSYVKDFGIDMLCLIPLERNPIANFFHESLSEKLAGTMKVPILTLALNYDQREL